MLAFVNQVLVGLIGDDDEVVLLGECGDFFRFAGEKTTPEGFCGVL